MNPLRGRPHRRLPHLPLRRLSRPVAVLATAVALAVTGSTLPAVASPPRPAAPQVVVSTKVSGLSQPWGIAFLPDGTMIWTERGGAIKTRSPGGTVRTLVVNLSGLFVGSETGLMGIAVDPDFATNRYFYACMGYQESGNPVDIRVQRFQLSEALTSAPRVGPPRVKGLPISSGRHGGCQLTFASDGTLRIGTGDAAVGTNPQDLSSLGGKTLRVFPTVASPPTTPSTPVAATPATSGPTATATCRASPSGRTPARSGPPSTARTATTR